ncbi:MAG: O-antigen ligase family protein [Rhodospirillales bacterium]|nr:O-antigen ligase family protein [Rhodospirillales bacterium]
MSGTANAMDGGDGATGAWLRRLDQMSATAVLLMAPGMLHAYVLAEICIGLVAVAFLARCALLGDWIWLRTPWVVLAGLWWLWLVFCSLPGVGRGGTASLIQAVVVVRYLVLAAALEHQVLRDAWLRRWLWRVLALCAAYIALQVYLQAFIGHNLFGQARWPSGELTGPFDKPRAGAPLSRLFFVALLPPAMSLIGRGSRAGGLAALVLTGSALAAQVLIGQRMPLLLVVMGFVVSAALLAPLRRPATIALLGAAILIAASAVLVPPTFYRLVTKFSAQMETFPTSPYGELAARAVAIAEQHPWTGRGFNGFRTGCAEPRYFHGWNWPANPNDDGGGLAGCNIHPHNHYLQALTDSGFPGLFLFAALVVTWLAVLGRGLSRTPTALRVGLFVALLIQQWPIASTSSAFAIEIGGLSFLLLGFGLAEARSGGIR